MASNIPFNITLLELTDEVLRGLKPVRVLDIFDGAGKNFHEDGLFSISIFGRMGDERRNRRFSYIDIKIDIIHPVVFKALTQLKKLYPDIISGKAYAIWNKELKDFEKTTPLMGNTGFNYFLEHWKEIKFEERPSIQREQNIALIKKFINKALVSKIVVMPAGLRDIEIQADGRVAEDEINAFYKKLLSLSNSITMSTIKNNPEVLDTIRLSAQNTFNQLYEYIENMVQGKKKLFMDKWAARKVFNGTRNVITSMNNASATLKSPGNISCNNTIIGLYQFLKATLPISRFHIKNGFLSTVFVGPNSPVNLVDKKTLKRQTVTIKPQYFDAWMTDEGIEKVITSFNEEGIRHSELEIEGYYIGLIYKGPDNSYKLFGDIDELPDNRSKADVFPITFCELLYLSVYKIAGDLPMFVTRYPIAGAGSIYPSLTYLKPTVKIETRTELNDNWENNEACAVCYQFPTKSEFVNSLSPHSTKLAGMKADFDGDVCSANIVYSDESIKEVKDLLNSKKNYIGTDGNFQSSVDTDTVQYVLFNMTGD